MSELPGSNNLRNPLVSILVTLVIVLLGFQLVGPMVGMMIAYPLFPGSHVEFADAIEEPFNHPELKPTILLMQGLGTFFGMIVLPYFILRKQQRSLNQLFSGYWYLRPAIIAAILVVVFMGVNSVVIEWNQNISFPGDEWARQIEKTLAEGTKFLTQFNSLWDLAFVFVIVAILPSIGEEIVFRGMIQNDFYRATKNIHIAIWVSAIMFSAIHIQFFGFFPRLLLGALFGYLYFWSGNLWIAVLAHFVNNGLMVIGLYLNQKGIIDIDLEQASSTPWQAVLFSAVCTILLLYAYKSFYNNNPKADIPD
jgi:uncharacterized protein